MYDMKLLSVDFPSLFLTSKSNVFLNKLTVTDLLMSFFALNTMVTRCDVLPYHKYQNPLSNENVPLISEA